MLNNLSLSEIEEEGNELVDFEEGTEARFATLSSLCGGDSDSEGDDIDSQFTV